MFSMTAKWKITLKYARDSLISAYTRKFSPTNRRYSHHISVTWNILLYYGPEDNIVII
jgi:hypothetical protein